MSGAYFRYMLKKLSTYIDEKTSDIDHNSVISELATRADISGSYLMSIVLANLIALLGLLVNSIAVVIGAMLISPLMGPIFTTGLSFTMGDFRLGRRALRNLGVSIILTITMAAFLTLISPLKDVTHEILVRSHPNIYDLFIAFFAGIAGAVAVCTRKNYLITTAGVAVATAVIPPLSVVGYGIGTWQWSIALGGFLLFFTNFVAIVLSADLVFYVLRFRASMVETSHSIRKRLLVMGVVLTLLSIPLVYTLVADIRKARITRGVEAILKKNLNREEHSRVTGFTQHSSREGITILATVNTVKYYGSEIEKKLEEELGKQLGQQVSLDLEQLIVKSGNIVPEAPARTVSSFPIPPPPNPETLGQLREKIMGRVEAACREVAPFLEPYPIQECGVRLSTEKPVTVLMTVARNRQINDQEERWLNIAMEKKLGIPVSLQVDTVPFRIPVSFDEEFRLTQASREALVILQKVKDSPGKHIFTILKPASAAKQANAQRETSLRDYLTHELKLNPSASVTDPAKGAEFSVRVRER